MEGCNSLKTHMVYVFVLLGCYRKYMGHLEKLALVKESNVLQYRTLQVIFELANESLKGLFAVYLSVFYIIIMLTAGISVLGVDVLDWYFYSSVPLAGFSVLVFMLIWWKMATSITEQSERIKQNWVKIVGQANNNLNTENGLEREIKVQKRIILKMIRSLKDISVEIGSVGIVTKGTSRFYLHSLMEDTVSVIVGVREIGALV